jgi:hypothetical protein
MAKLNNKDLSPSQREAILSTLKNRFKRNMHYHKELEWSKIQAKLESQPEKLWSLHQMEETGGEPDVVNHDKSTDEYIFYDCSTESPKGRRSICYDHEALSYRKENKPKNSAMGMAVEMGIELLTEEQYRELQCRQNEGEKFDSKTSSWIITPDDIRALGGALFADWRYGHVFVYHNGADSYYAARGFRGLLRV